MRSDFSLNQATSRISKSAQERFGQRMEIAISNYLFNTGAFICSTYTWRLACTSEDIYSVGWEVHILEIIFPVAERRRK